MEKWEEIYTQEDLYKLQKIEIESLRVFIEVCTTLKIEWFLYGGTLLGAVKYSGIIPWDDDIDVAMTRDNYNRFLKEAPSILPKEYVIQSPYNEKRSPYVYTKLRRRNTKYIEQYHHRLPIEKGVYIDIYAVDNIPDDEIQRKEQYDEVRKWILQYYYRQCLHLSFPIWGMKKIKNAIGQLLFYLIGHLHSQEYYIKKIDSAMTKYNNSKTTRMACLYSPNYDNIYSKLYPLEKGKFENLDVWIPSCYQEHLRLRYGDYAKLPPEEQRIGHYPYLFDIKEINHEYKSRYDE